MNKKNELKTIPEKKDAVDSNEKIISEKENYVTEKINSNDKINEETTKKRVLVFGPGLYRALAFVGAFKLLEENGIAIDKYIGFGFGELIAYLFAKHDESSRVEWDIFNLLYSQGEGVEVDLQKIQTTKELSKKIFGKDIYLKKPFMRELYLGKIDQSRYDLFVYSIMKNINEDNFMINIPEKGPNEIFICLDALETLKFKNNKIKNEKKYTKYKREYGQWGKKQCDIFYSINLKKRFIDYVDNLQDYFDDGKNLSGSLILKIQNINK